MLALVHDMFQELTSKATAAFLAHRPRKHHWNHAVPGTKGLQRVGRFLGGGSLK